MVELLGSSYSDPYTSNNASFTHIWSNDGTYIPEKYYYPDPSNLNHLIYCDISGICKEFNWFVDMKTDLSKDFHTYSLEWTSTDLIWSVDNIERFRALSNIPKVPQFIICNIGSAQYNHVFTSSEVPMEMVIKSVSVYQNS